MYVYFNPNVTHVEIERCDEIDYTKIRFYVHDEVVCMQSYVMTHDWFLKLLPAIKSTYDKVTVIPVKPIDERLNHSLF